MFYRLISAGLGSDLYVPPNTDTGLVADQAGRVFDNGWRAAAAHQPLATGNRARAGAVIPYEHVWWDSANQVHKEGHFVLAWTGPKTDPAKLVSRLSFAGSYTGEVTIVPGEQVPRFRPAREIARPAVIPAPPNPLPQPTVDYLNGLYQALGEPHKMVWVDPISFLQMTWNWVNSMTWFTLFSGQTIGDGDTWRGYDGRLFYASADPKKSYYGLVPELIGAKNPMKVTTPTPSGVIETTAAPPPAAVVAAQSSAALAAAQVLAAKIAPMPGTPQWYQAQALLQRGRTPGVPTHPA